MTPVVASMLSPAGRAGATEYETTVPPPLVGPLGAIGYPVLYVTGLAEYLRLLGGTSLTVMLKGKLVVPPLLVTVTLYVAVAAMIVGVPEMTPVVALRLNPAGNPGETEYETTAPPVLVGVLAGMSAPLV